MLDKYSIRIKLTDTNEAAWINHSGDISISIFFLYKMYLMERLIHHHDSEFLCPTDYDPSGIRDFESFGHSWRWTPELLKNICFASEAQSRIDKTDESHDSLFVRFFSAVCWVLCHEIGHYICGHFAAHKRLDFHYQVAPIGSSSLSHDDVLPFHGIEFSADFYATYRTLIIWNMVYSCTNNERALGAMLGGCSTALVSLSDQALPFDDFSYHPSNLSRFVAFIASVINCSYPLNNANSGFIPDYALWKRESDEDNYGLLGNEELLLLQQAMLPPVRAVKRLQLNEFKSINERSLAFAFLITASLWRIGYACEKEDLPEPLGGLQLTRGMRLSTLLELCSIEFHTPMEDLCTRANIYYGSAFPEGMSGAVTLEMCHNYRKMYLADTGAQFVGAGQVSETQDRELNFFFRIILLIPLIRCWMLITAPFLWPMLVIGRLSLGYQGKRSWRE